MASGIWVGRSGVDFMEVVSMFDLSGLTWYIDVSDGTLFKLHFEPRRLLSPSPILFSSCSNLLSSLAKRLAVFSGIGGMQGHQLDGPKVFLHRRAQHDRMMSAVTIPPMTLAA